MKKIYLKFFIIAFLISWILGVFVFIYQFNIYSNASEFSTEESLCEISFWRGGPHRFTDFQTCEMYNKLPYLLTPAIILLIIVAVIKFVYKVDLFKECKNLFYKKQLK